MAHRSIGTLPCGAPPEPNRSLASMVGNPKYVDGYGDMYTEGQIGFAFGKLLAERAEMEARINTLERVVAAKEETIAILKEGLNGLRK